MTGHSCYISTAQKHKTFLIRMLSLLFSKIRILFIKFEFIVLCSTVNIVAQQANQYIVAFHIAMGHCVMLL